MKKKITILLTLLLLIMTSCTAFAKKGVVVFYNSSGKIAIQTDYGYTVGEVMSVPIMLDRGDTVTGDLESYGTHDIYDITTDETFSLWVDDYWLSRDRAIDWIQRHTY